MRAKAGAPGFWKTDWFLGLGISLLVLLAGQGDLLRGLERKAYDLGVQASSRTPSPQIAVIAIDERSIANLGRWPWSRELHARMTDLLAGAGAKVVANTIFFSEPQRDAGYATITRLIDMIAAASAEGGTSPPLVAQLDSTLRDAEQQLNTDRRLAESYAQAGNVVLPILFQLGEPQGRPDHELPAFVRAHRLTQVLAGEGEALPAQGVQYPLAQLGQPARALGHLNANADVDGAVRNEPLVIRYFDQYYPSLALAIAATSLNLRTNDLQVRQGESVQLGKLHIPTDRATQMYPFFYTAPAGQAAFPVDAFYDVLSGAIPASKYAGKIVLIGATAPGVGVTQVTPVSPAMPPVVSLAHVVSSLLQGHFFQLPAWGAWLVLAVNLLIAVYLMVLLPRLGAAVGAAATAGLIVLLLGGQFGLMVGLATWVPLTTAVVLLVVGHLLLTTKRFLVTERGKQKSELESAESNRMLGLAFQGQGQLDMAFDKFRKCPMDDGLMDNMYNLALDYERKRQFNKAEAVFRYLHDFKPDFRDLGDKLQRAKQLSEAVLLGGSRGQTAGGTVILTDGQIEKPMLGRYQIEKELGKGAMGVVYQGRDPKINRVVAIKTMALAEEFEAGELEEVKARFFREAETAGRLNHPNIVTMYDAGEEQDLAYIAMELLKGHDLVPHTKPDKLLPLPRVLSIIGQVAVALHYAHQHQVVHRDIKPGNIMFEPESGQVKVTDFGIARITDASRTRTGMVLGTPSYMSPEQLAGQRIDGRSDLFSLGVTLYQLCCGQLPFVGESMAQLMYKIANEPPVPISTQRAGLPPALLAIIDKALNKDVAQRYQSGGAMATDLKACLAALMAAAKAKSGAVSA